MLRLFRSKSSPEELASQMMPRVVEQWLQGFDKAELELGATPSMRFRAKREWVLMELCAWVAGGLIAMQGMGKGQALLAAVREEAAALLTKAGLFSSTDEVTGLFLERLATYGASTPDDIGKRFEACLGLEAGLLRRLTIAGTFFPSMQAAQELFSGLRKSVRW